MPPTLHDGALTLRPPRLSDADAVTAACQDPAIQRWTFVPSPYRREHAEAWLANRADDVVTFLAFEEGRAGFAPWAKTRDGTRPSGPAFRLVGSFSLMEIDGDYGEIGYWVTAEARGRGVATRAVRLLHDWAVTQGFRHLEILPHQDNAPSRRVAEKCGYANTGELRKPPRGAEVEPVYVVYAWKA